MDLGIGGLTEVRLDAKQAPDRAKTAIKQTAGTEVRHKILSNKLIRAYLIRRCTAHADAARRPHPSIDNDYLERRQWGHTRRASQLISAVYRKCSKVFWPKLKGSILSNG